MQYHNISPPTIKPPRLFLTVGTLTLVAALFYSAVDANAALIDIPAQPLDKALNALAHQSGERILFSTDLTEKLSAPSVKGNLATKDALEKLLNGTGLVLKSLEKNGYTVIQSPVTSKIIETLPEVTVNPEKENAESSIQGYVAKNGKSATKTDTPLLETPQSISVVTRDQMDMQNVQSAEQALRYTAGVLTEVGGYDLRYESSMIRGFSATKYRDGLIVKASGNYGDWITPAQNLERVEVLKGPSAVLYGQGSPGGIINQVSKKPRLDQINEVSVSLGNNDRYQTAFDIGGKLNEQGTLLYRVNGLIRDSHTQTDFAKDENLFIAPSLTWLPDDKTSLTILSDFTVSRVTPKPYWPNKILTDENPLGKIPVSRTVGEPNYDRYNRDTQSIGYTFEHTFDSEWTVRQNLKYTHIKLDSRQVYGDALQADFRTVDRGSFIANSNGTAWAIDNQAQKKFYTGEISHKVLLGFDFQKYKSREDLGFGNAPSLDIFNPVYGTAFTDPVTSANRQQLKQNGLYAQDQMRLDKWIFNLGLRKDWATTESSDDTSAQIVDDTKITGSAGLLYLFDNGLAPYASYSTAFNPVLEIGFNGNAFKPETGKQYEVGIKYQPTNYNSFITLSAFDLRKQNVDTIDPDHPSFNIQTGEVHSRGLELEGKASLYDGLNLLASYTLLDIEVSKSNDPTQIGKQPRQTAKNTASMWLDYRFKNETLHGWGLGTGVRYVGKVPGDDDNTYYNQSYTLVDAVISYKKDHYGFALNATNLFDKEYTANAGNFYGQARTVIANFTYQW